MMSEYLQHYGVLGMKWGRVREKLTPPKQPNYRAEAQKMSTADLEQRLKRLRLENEYAKLNSADVVDGKKIVTNFLSKAANNIAMNLVAGTITKIGQNYIKQKFGI